MSQVHAMMAEPNHDEQAEQLFIRDLKVYMAENIDPSTRELTNIVGAEIGDPAGLEIGQVRDELLTHDVFRAWIDHRRISQEMMWDAVGASVDRQLPELSAKARIERPKGSVELDPAFRPPRYTEALDTHMMPGGYASDLGEGDIRQGAMIDRGGAVYMLGRNGGMMNDVRGHTTVAHLFDLYPDLEPKRILDLGCAVGASTVAVKSYFPDAEVHAVDVGGAMLRYAHARAEHLGQAIHFSQQDAERTRFEDESFDLVYSCVLLHETSGQAVRNIFKECRRLLRPGGVMIHNEVPSRISEMGLWGKVIADFEALYNNEPFWRGAQSLDFEKIMREAGFTDTSVGYQPAIPAARRGQHSFMSQSLGPFRSWLMVSARK